MQRLFACSVALLSCGLLTSVMLGQTKTTFAEEANGPSRSQDLEQIRRKSDPYNLSRPTRTIDRDQIKTFVTGIMGPAADGPIEESEAEEIIKAFQRKNKVYVPDRDVLITSGLTQKELIRALEKSLVEGNTNNKAADPLYRTSIGQLQPWDKLSLQEKQAILTQVETGIFFRVQPGVRPPGLRDYAGNQPSTSAAYDTNGNQKTTAAKSSYWGKPSVVGGEYRGAGMKVVDRDDFLAFGPDFNDLETMYVEQGGNNDADARRYATTSFRRTSYSNGQPCGDSMGRPLYPNGRRKFSDTGVPLYSNGRPKTDINGNKLHSNGRRKYSDDGRPLYASGKARQTRDGVDLHQNGNRRWSDDGRSPVAAKTSYTDRTKQKDNYIDPIQLYPDGWTAGQATGLRSGARQLYANGTPKENQDGVKLHPNGQRRFTGDGVGNSPYEPANDKVDFVKELYSSGKPTYTASADRLYSSGARKGSTDGESLYPNGQSTASSTAAALTPSGQAIIAGSKPNTLKQGPFLAYRIFEGTISAMTQSSLELKNRKEKLTLRLPRDLVLVTRLTGASAEPATAGQLLVGMNIKAVFNQQIRYLDGEMIDDDDQSASAIALFSSDPRLGNLKASATKRDLMQLRRVRVKSLANRELVVEDVASRSELTFNVEDTTAVQQIAGSKTSPGDRKLIRPGQYVQILTREDLLPKKPVSQGVVNEEISLPVETSKLDVLAVLIERQKLN